MQVSLQNCWGLLDRFLLSSSLKKSWKSPPLVERQEPSRVSLQCSQKSPFLFATILCLLVLLSDFYWVRTPSKTCFTTGTAVIRWTELWWLSEDSSLSDSFLRTVSGTPIMSLFCFFSSNLSFRTAHIYPKGPVKFRHKGFMIISTSGKDAQERLKQELLIEKESVI